MIPNIGHPQLAPVRIAPQPGSTLSNTDAGATSDDDYPQDGRKDQKRAANRKSAQLSRKRKKLYIEELKEENDDLRRKEQILRSIPDLVVVFDSAGKLGFVSQSASNVLKVPAVELEGTSFWDRLCDDSVRLLKAAFMDALAARLPDSDQAPLGSGIWELRLVDRDGEHIIVSLNGMVHFAGEKPECVCSIRPCDGANDPIDKERTAGSFKSRGINKKGKSSQTSVISVDSTRHKIEQQSVVTGASSILAGGDSDVAAHNARVSQRRQEENIHLSSDPSGFSSSGDSESGSSDEMTGVSA
jgi:PAS domain-containing protein